MFKPMKKIVNLGEGMPKIVVEQDSDGSVFVSFDATGDYVLVANHHNPIIAALGFPTEPLEETVEQIEGVIE